MKTASSTGTHTHNLVPFWFAIIFLPQGLGLEGMLLASAYQLPTWNCKFSFLNCEYSVEWKIHE